MFKFRLSLILLLLLAVILAFPACDKNKTPEETEPAGECKHSFGEWEVLMESTCSQNGKRVRACTLCGKMENEDMTKLDHTVEAMDKVDPTCTVEGKTAGVKCSVCNEVLQSQEAIEAKGHTEVIDNAVEATCTAAGLTQGMHCSVCNEVLQAQETVEAKGHTEVIDNAVEATCTAAGLTQGKHCSVCNEVLQAQEVIKAKGHSYVDGVCHCGAEDENYIPPVSGPAFIVSPKGARRGDTVEITVALKNNPGIASIILSLVFDNDALTLNSVTYNNSIGGYTIQPQYKESPIKLYWIDGFANAEGDFVLATLSFTVKDDATLGDHALTMSYRPDDVYDISETNLPFEIINGAITVKE